MSCLPGRFLLLLLLPLVVVVLRLLLLLLLLLHLLLLLRFLNQRVGAALAAPRGTILTVGESVLRRGLGFARLYNRLASGMATRLLLGAAIIAAASGAAAVSPATKTTAALDSNLSLIHI